MEDLLREGRTRKFDPTKIIKVEQLLLLLLIFMTLSRLRLLEKKQLILVALGENFGV